jgi:hypothetical protein
MRARIRIVTALTLATASWTAVLLKLGVWSVTVQSHEGVLPRTFNGWSAFPISRHLFLAQYDPDDFERLRTYTSYTYPFIFSNYILLAPLHFLLGLPYGLAQNYLAYFYVLCLTLLLFLLTKKGLGEIIQTDRWFLWIVVFVSIGITVTDPLPWLCTLRYNPDDFHIVSIACFCYLSTWVFRAEVPKTPLLVIGIFLALWSPMYIPAWILAGIFFNRALVIERRWLFQVAGVSVLALLTLEIPALLSRWFGLTPASSGFLFRSGLDGSTAYLTSIYQAVFRPVQERHWPAAFYVVIAVLLGLVIHFRFQDRERRHYPLQQAAFLLIPYSTTAILFPQFTSIHPYFTDQLLAIPACFLFSFWFLQKEFWSRLTGKTYVAWLIASGLIVMTNLLTVAQNTRGLRFYLGIVRSAFS